MDPYPVAGARLRLNGREEEAVDPLVGPPGRLVVLRIEREIVEKGPQGAVGETVIVLLDVARREEDRQVPLRRQLGGDGRLLLGREPVGVDARPADPQVLPAARDRAEAGGEPAGTRGIGEPSLALLDGEGEPVGDNHRAWHVTPPSNRARSADAIPPTGAAVRTSAHDSLSALRPWMRNPLIPSVDMPEGHRGTARLTKWSGSCMI